LAHWHKKRENLAPGFLCWFQKEEANTFTISMIKSVCKVAQVEDDFTMNPSESLNKELKSWVDQKNRPYHDKLKQEV